MLNATEVKREVRNFIQNDLLYGNEVTFSDDDSFLEYGLIDSTGILELIRFLEDRFQFSVEDDEVTPENLDSINRLENFVLRKQILFSQQVSL